MTNIQRYSVTGQTAHAGINITLDAFMASDGAFVLHSDHLSLTQALEAERDRAVAENGKMRAALEQIANIYSGPFDASGRGASGRMRETAKRALAISTTPQKDA